MLFHIPILFITILWERCSYLYLADDETKALRATFIKCPKQPGCKPRSTGLQSASSLNPDATLPPSSHWKLSLPTAQDGQESQEGWRRNNRYQKMTGNLYMKPKSSVWKINVHKTHDQRVQNLEICLSHFRWCVYLLMQVIFFLNKSLQNKSTSSNG